MTKSRSFQWSDFKTRWYKRWANELRQDDAHKENYDVHSNKFWQNAAIVQALWECGVIAEGKSGIGFGVGQERLPALFANYKVKITATDQSVRSKNAKHWAEYELAQSIKSLNRLKICDKQQFNEYVRYESADMKRIKKKYLGQYDFVWSNCALGHLGSIESGMKFIEESARCLRDGGVAVHTTEINILSNSTTVDKGDTVIFRLRDIYNLQEKLLNNGYRMRPLVLTYGKSKEDRRISFMPEFGNSYSKIRVGGHLATQVLLIIDRPKRLYRPLQERVNSIAHKTNLFRMEVYRRFDTMQRLVGDATVAWAENRNITGLIPETRVYNVSVKRGDSKEIRIKYSNKSGIAIFGVITSVTPPPVVLGTYGPANRKSRFHGREWASDNRPTIDITNIRGEKVEYIKPGEEFYVSLVLDASGVKMGSYTEDFGLIQENIAWVEDSVVKVVIKVK